MSSCWSCFQRCGKLSAAEGDASQILPCGERGSVGARVSLGGAKP
jgi:hypothetical protein